MTDINNCGQFITPEIARLARATMLNTVPDHVAMHPLQKAAVLNALPIEVIVEGISTLDQAKHFAPWPETFCGLRLVEDRHMVKNEIHFRNKDGRIIAKITNLAVPSERTPDPDLSGEVQEHRRDESPEGRIDVQELQVPKGRGEEDLQ